MRRFASVLGILGFVNVPLVHYSVKLWTPEQQLHPVENTLLDPRMVHARVICFTAVFLLFSYLLSRRYQLERARHALDQLRFRVGEGPFEERT